MRQGFNIIEMSVAIVIIALIMAGILQGRNLIENAKIRNIISEINSHKVAVRGFTNKYNRYPGDFNMAVAFWGAGTEDGDNNGAIEFENDDEVHETYRAWQHLSYAQMVTSLYTGTQTTGAPALGEDVPQAKIGGGYVFDYGRMGMDNKNVIILGRPLAASESPVPASGVLTPAQAMDIDRKIDDGLPEAGRLRAEEGDSADPGTCVDSNVYTIANQEAACIIAVASDD